MGSFDPNRDPYLLASAFVNPDPGKWGNAPRYLNVRGPKRLDESFAVIKDTRIGERFTHEFRMEMQNPLNRVVFGNPVTELRGRQFRPDCEHGRRAAEHSIRHESDVLIRRDRPPG